MALTTLIGFCNFIFLHILATRATSYDHYLLSCGSAASTRSSLDNRTWNSDNNSTFSNSFSSTTVAATPSTSLHSVPFFTARVFSTNFTYSFHVSPGPKFIRLFFNPSFVTDSLSAKDAYLTVQSNSDHLLLRNFSAYLSDHSQGFVEKEFVNDKFYIHVARTPLQLTFFSSRPGSNAYVNGIEVVSVPDGLYVNEQQPPVNLDSPGTEFSLYNSNALEKAYRLNVGGTELNPLDDSGAMHRRWFGHDGDYLIDTYRGTETTGDADSSSISYTKLGRNYSAPPAVYQTFRSMGTATPENFKRKVNITWEFELDLGFSYLVRLHWCEVVVDINSSNYRVFTVYVGGLVAENQIDVFEVAGFNSAYYKDYVVYMGTAEAYRNGSSSRGNLQLAMHPYFFSKPLYWDILLNGLEIFKISKSDGSLNGANSADALPIDQPLQPKISTTHPHSIFPVIIGVVSITIFLVAVYFCFLVVLRRSECSKTSSAGPSATNSSKSKALFSYGKSCSENRSGGGSSYLPSHLCRHFTLMEIRQATSEFSDSLIVGHGGFGNVYKGTVESEAGSTLVAIKRLKALSTQGAREFAMEIQLLSKLRHVNLVSLIGYCDEAGEMILVYEFMSHGTLRDHLQPKNTKLSWLKRLEVCVGAARGLNYLHTGTDRMVIHRDVKTANILLDEGWIAKVADFGLSKLGPTGADLSHVSTAVKGSFGYVDPEYYRRQQLTEKSDVYSFGVVLFEVLCGRAAVNPSLPKEQVNLRIWARKKQLSGALDTIVDPNLVGQIVPESLRKFGEVAESCVRDEGAQRPSMADVIGGLELALKLQIEDMVSTGLACTVADKGDNEYPILNIKSPTTHTTARLLTNSDSEANTWMNMSNSTSGKFSSSASGSYGGSTPVFSEILKPEGR